MMFKYPETTQQAIDMLKDGPAIGVPTHEWLAKDPNAEIAVNMLINAIRMSDVIITAELCEMELSV